MIRALAAACLLSALCASCGSADDTTPEPTPPPAKGTVELRFSVSSGVRKSPNLVDPLTGTIYGSIYRAEDVTVTGPLDGAQSVGDVEVSAVDLTTDDVSSVSFTSEPIPASSYVFLGFYDVDGNGAMVHDPDNGDPVTLALSNRFDIEGDKKTSFTAVFELVLN